MQKAGQFRGGAQDGGQDVGAAGAVCEGVGRSATPWSGDVGRLPAPDRHRPSRLTCEVVERACLDSAYEGSESVRGGGEDVAGVVALPKPYLTVRCGKFNAVVGLAMPGER